MDTKFTLSVQTMVAAGTGQASLIGMWYALQGEIEEAKQKFLELITENMSK